MVQVWGKEVSALLRQRPAGQTDFCTGTLDGPRTSFDFRSARLVASLAIPLGRQHFKLFVSGVTNEVRLTKSVPAVAGWLEARYRSVGGFNQLKTARPGSNPCVAPRYIAGCLRRQVREMHVVLRPGCHPVQVGLQPCFNHARSTAIGM
jgi:hypothetical protein